MPFHSVLRGGQPGAARARQALGIHMSIWQCDDPYEDASGGSMAHKRLAGTFAVALAVPIAAVILPATMAAAAPAQPAQAKGSAASDIREGTRAPNTLD